MAEAISQSIGILGWHDHFVVAGDFNSALPIDAGVREMRSHFAELDCGQGPTHELGGRLDHIFTGQEDRPFACRTGDVRYGSDHSPLVAIIRD